MYSIKHILDGQRWRRQDRCESRRNGCWKRIHTGQPVGNKIFLSGDVLDLKDIALEKDAPTDDDWDLAGLDPEEVAMISFEKELFAT